MKTLVIGVLALFLIGGGIFFGLSRLQKNDTNTCKTIQNETVTFTMTENGYTPESTTIKQCTKVIFRNAGTTARWPASDLHPTHEIYPEFDPKEPVDPGKEWSFVFDRVGKWRYHDHLSPYIRGTIVVSE